MVGGCADQVVRASSRPCGGRRAYGSKKIYGLMITQTLNATVPLGLLVLPGPSQPGQCPCLLVLVGDGTAAASAFSCCLAPASA
jgi:hypothetical protein